MNILQTIKKQAIFQGETPLVSAIFAGMIVGICLLGIVTPQITQADLNPQAASYVAKDTNPAPKVTKTIKVVVTAYSSTVDQTDDTPFITASGKHVADGIVANNLLPMGTKVRIPALFGDKVFTVEDRMNRKKSDYHFDVWLPTRSEALTFGVKNTEIEVLEN